jgi:RimJ/RimL family protein N-acetyltransferase
VTIRRAVVEDVPRIAEMGARFIDTEYPHALRFDAEQLAATTQRLMAHGLVLVADAGDGVVGMLALTTYQHPLSGDRIATEIVWWVDPEVRGGRAALQLFAAGEAWARAEGATHLQMIAPSDKVGRFYERLGFAKLETHYQRAL